MESAQLGTNCEAEQATNERKVSETNNSIENISSSYSSDVIKPNADCTDLSRKTSFSSTGSNNISADENLKKSRESESSDSASKSSRVALEEARSTQDSRASVRSSASNASTSASGCSEEAEKPLKKLPLKCSCKKGRCQRCLGCLKISCFYGCKCQVPKRSYKHQKFKHDVYVYKKPVKKDAASASSNRVSRKEIIPKIAYSPINQEEEIINTLPRNFKYFCGAAAKEFGLEDFTLKKLPESLQDEAVQKALILSTNHYYIPEIAATDVEEDLKARLRPNTPPTNEDRMARAERHYADRAQWFYDIRKKRMQELGISDLREYQIKK